MLEPVALETNCRVSNFRDEAQRIVGRSERESRLIIAYTQHERNLFADYAGIDVSPRYRDARIIALHWKKTLHPELTLSARGLKNFLELIEYPREKYLGMQQTTKRIRAVRNMIARKGSYTNRTPTVRAQWTKLLQHNAIDCDGIGALVIRCVRELEDPDS